MKTYHFCVSYQNTHYFDGTVNTDADLIDEETYNKFKEWLGQGMKPPREGSEIILISLTVIG